MTRKFGVAVTLMAVCLAARVSIGDVWQDLAKYRYGEGDAAGEAEKLMQSTPVDQHGAIEDALIGILSSKDATQDGKACACRMLQQVGTEKAIPAAAGLLNDEVLAHYGLLFLERIGSPKACEAMRAALDGAPDKAKTVILQSLGECRDGKAVAQAAKFARHSDALVAGSAIAALGKIGGKDAAAALVDLRPGDNLKAVYMEALAVCAATLDASAAVPLFEKVLAGDRPAARVAALRGLAAADEKKAARLMPELVRSDDYVVRTGVLTLVADGKGEAVTKAMASVLDGLPEEQKTALVTALGERGDKAAMASIVACLSSTNSGLRHAAIAAVGSLGDPKSLKLLLEMNDPKAGEAIARMHGQGIDEGIMEALKDSKLAVPAIKAAVARSCSAATPALLSLVAGQSADVRKEAWNALGSLATETDISALVREAFAVKAPEEVPAAMAAVRNVCTYAQDKAKCFEAIASRYDGATEAAKSSIFDFVSAVGSPEALGIVRKALKSGNKDLYGKALRAMAGWRDAAPFGDLLEQAGAAAEEVDRIVALRGCIQMASSDKNKLGPDERMDMLKKAAGIATRPDEKKLIISGLKLAASADALDLLARYWDDEALRNEVEQAGSEMAWNLRKSSPGQARKLAEKLQNSKNGGVAEKARKTLAEM